MARKTRRNRKKMKKKSRKTKRYATRRKLNYYKKKFRKFTKNYRKMKKRSRKMKGGSKANFTYGCNYPENMGKIITGYSNNTNPFLPDPNPLNSNLRPHVVGQKGGGWMYDFGLGDLLLNYYKATDFGKNVWHRYKGNKKLTSAEPTNQPELRKNIIPQHNTANLPEFYELSTTKAAKNTIS
tara:strand:+ start:1452 stop:1997 length:546 start_codon:yes stop_codon:yes gene_type:complete